MKLKKFQKISWHCPFNIAQNVWVYSTLTHRITGRVRWTSPFSLWRVGIVHSFKDFLPAIFAAFPVLSFRDFLSSFDFSSHISTFFSDIKRVHYRTWKSTASNEQNTMAASYLKRLSSDESCLFEYLNYKLRTSWKNYAFCH